MDNIEKDEKKIIKKGEPKTEEARKRKLEGYKKKLLKERKEYMF